LLVGEPLKELKEKAPWVWRYLRYGMTTAFDSGKAKPVPVPKRSTCVARDPWYDLTELAKPGFAFWPKGQQYRHMVIANPDGCPGASRLYDMKAIGDYDTDAFIAVLNSTLVALWRNFYGRYTGMEGASETMVLDVCMTEVPDPTRMSACISERLKSAFHKLGARVTGDMIEEQLMDCHTPDRARRIAAGPLVLSQELQRAGDKGTCTKLSAVAHRTQTNQPAPWCLRQGAKPEFYATLSVLAQSTSSSRSGSRAAAGTAVTTRVSPRALQTSMEYPSVPSGAT
jgi:hypothetical protein